MQEALFYEKESKSRVRCHLCWHQCLIAPGKRGRCGVRENRDGSLVSLVYGQLVAGGADPVEKKPLYHFLPGTQSYSISTVGCNFTCLHCQNHQLSQYPIERGGGIIGRVQTPAEVVASAGRHHCESISYTYVEPTIFYEFTRDCAELAHQKTIKNIYVSNGYMSSDAVKEMATFLDGVNIDIKAMNDHFYKEVCNARLQPVLDNVRFFYELGVWVEITTLIIPGLNDRKEELRQLATFIVEIDPEIPWHISAFRPMYKMMDCPPATINHLASALQVGKEAGLHHIYMGNVVGAGETTYCPGCGEAVVERRGYTIQNNQLYDGRCPKCNTRIAGCWS
ncbi:MAG: AmmeMemoRadiSam system radical SAM enzyme [Desulfobacterales bacterium]|nr:MAG: AmmeMemoRadiSam system radical SAM enzyme [Desulfobacterales bacterium]